MEINNNEMLECLNFFNGFEGLSHALIDSGSIYQEYPSMTDLLRITDTISFNGTHPVLDNLENHDKDTALSIPAPATLLTMVVRDTEWRKYYNDITTLVADIATAYNKLIAAIFAAGIKEIRYLDYAWPPLLDNENINLMIQDGIDVPGYMQRLIEVTNLSLDNLDPAISVELRIIPERDLAGRFSSNYSLIAPSVFPEIKTAGICLDFLADTTNDYTALTHIPEDKRLCISFFNPSLPLPTDARIEAQLEEARKHFSGTLTHETNWHNEEAICEELLSCAIL